MRTPTYPNIGDIVDSRYRLKKILGGGGMGKVYLAQDLQDGCDVALKMLSDTFSSEKERAVFEREFNAIKNLSHPGVVRVYERGPGYFTMEYVDGRPLSDLKEGDVSQIFEIGIDITKILVYIHAEGVIHRDLKPENIKITGSGQVKILDFGLATRDEVTNLLSSGQINIAGTLNYMAPELIKGFQIDPRADLYSLGIIFYELTTGRLPFKSSDLLTTIMRSMEITAPPPSEFNSKITPGFEAIIMKLITKDPGERFQSADELLADMVKLAGRSEIIKIRVDKGSQYLQSPKLIGRSIHMMRLTAALNRAVNGKGQFVLIKGEEGLGKTRLIKDFQTQKGTQGALVLDVACKEHQGLPFAPFSFIIYQLFKHLEKTESQLLYELSRKWGALFLALIPPLQNKPYMERILPEEDLSPSHIQEELKSFFLEYPKITPLALFLDDLHWADRASCELLASIIQESQDYNLLLCGTYRGDFKAGETPFQKLLPRLREKKFCEEIELSPLNIEDIGPFVGSMVSLDQLDEALLERLHEISRGIPLLLEETVKNMAEEGLIYRKGGVWEINVDDLRKIPRPSLLEDALIEKAEKLDKKHTKVLQAATVIGQRCVTETLKSLTKIKDHELGIIIADLISQGFFSEVREGLKFSYVIASPKLVEYIYERIDSKSLCKLHEEIARELEESESPSVEELAYHYSRSKNFKKAIQYLINAGDHVYSNYYFKDAINYYEQALKLAEEKGSTKQSQDLLGKLGLILSRTQQYDVAIQYFQKGLELAKRNRSEEDVYHRGMGLACFYKGEFDQALEHFQSILESKKDNKDFVSEDLSHVGNIYIALGDYVKAEEKLKEALTEARASNKHDLQVSLYISFAQIHFMKGEWSNAMNYYHRAFEVLEHTSDELLKAKISEGVAQIYIYKGKTREAYKYLEEALYHCHIIGDHEYRMMLEIEMGFLYEYEGNLNKAMEIYKRCVETAEGSGYKIAQAHAYLKMARPMIYKEKLPDAITYCRKAMKVFKDMRIGWAVAEGYMLLGEAFSRQGEYDKAKKAFSASEKGFVNLQMTWKLIGVYAGVSGVLQKTGNAKLTNKTLNKALAIAKKYDDDVMLAKIHSQYGLFCAGSGYYTESLEHFVRAIHILEKLNCRLELARVYYEYGRILLDYERKGERGYLKVAIHQLKKAEEIYEHAGHRVMLNKARLLIKECERERVDAVYKWDLAVKIRDFAKQLGDLGKDIQLDFKKMSQEFASTIGDDMDRNTLLTEVEKRISAAESEMNKRVEELRAKNAKLMAQVEELKAERENLLTLQKISNTINSVLDSKKLINMIMDMVIEVVRAERGFLMIKNKDGSWDFKAARNIDKEELSNEDFNVSNSIVKKVIKTGESVLTSDAQADGRFESDSIRDLKLKSIVCVPFKIKDEVIGAIYVDNRFVSGLFTERDLDFLVAFSNQAAIAIENARLYEELREKERLDQELTIASRLQARFLPKTVPKVRGVELYGRMIPARKVGGDYYDFIVPSEGDSVSIVIGDVSGKGIPAGLVMVMARLILHHFLADSKSSTRDILIQTNKILKENTEPFIFMSLLLARWDNQTNKLRYTGAGHENLIIYRPKSGIEVIPAGGVVLGIKDQIDGFLEEKEVSLEKGDTLILYTDGVTESSGPSGDMLEVEGFLNMIKKHIGNKPRELVDALFNDLKEFMGSAEQHDDITLTVLRKI